jgi:glycyl-tRNA synthetase
MNQVSLETLTALAKRRGFVFPTSEIYGGLSNCYDYGPLGVQLLKNIKDAWWKEFIEARDDMVGLDSQIILHPQTWVASGHVDSFSDPLVEDKVTHKRYRADHIIESWVHSHSTPQKIVVEDLSVKEMGAFLSDNNVTSPDGNELTSPKSFNLLFESEIGAVSGDKAKIYLRGETAQGIFTNFKQILDSSRVKLPFGVGQIGSSFRNEITTGQFIFRTLEFQQAEIEYFFDPDNISWETLMETWKADMWSFVTNSLGVNKDHLQWRRHTDKERSHYSKDTYDLDYRFPFGYKELWGVAYRTDYDLTQHQELSGKSLQYTDPYTGKKFTPHVIEPALGINRAFLMVLAESYFEDQEKNRVILKIPAKLAPYKAAVFPLLKNKPELVDKAKQVFDLLKSNFTCTFDDRGNIGKRYLNQDEIGTPYCITVDFDTLKNDTVTIRDRDSANQTRVNLGKVKDYLFVNLQ